MLDLDYKVLKELYNNSKGLKVGNIAKIFSIPHSTVGSCVKRLEQDGYVIYERYKPLHYELGLDPMDAHNESEKFHLLFSCNTINRICEKYGHPKTCPCGDMILSSIDCACEEKQ